jgi:hypothetical protein
VSRGYGIVQRKLLAILRKHGRSALAVAAGLDTITLASLVYEGPHYRALRLAEPKQQVAVRRALAALAREGLVVRLEMRRPKQHCPWWARARCHWRAAPRRR